MALAAQGANRLPGKGEGVAQVWPDTGGRPAGLSGFFMYAPCIYPVFVLYSPRFFLAERGHLPTATCGCAEAAKAPYDLMSRAWKAAAPTRKVVRFKASRMQRACATASQGVGWEKILIQVWKWYVGNHSL